MSLSEEADIEEEEALFEIASDTTDENGRYLLTLEKEEDYRMMFKKDGYFYEKVNISTHNKVRSDTFEYDAIYLEEISKEPIVFYIYYEFDQYELTKKAKNKIDTTLYAILEETPDIIVEISSHTDSQGDSAYNQELSQKRAQKVVDYLIKKGIEESRLVAKGYGETQPIADNDTPEGRAKNRRTEFAVIGSKDPFSKLNVSEFRIISKDNKKGTIEEKQEEGKKEEDEDEKVDDKKEEKEEKKEEKKTFNKRQKPPSKTNRRF